MLVQNSSRVWAWKYHDRKGRYHLKESWTSWPWEIAPNLNGPPGVFTYPRTKHLTWPFPSIVWLRSGTNMKVENLRSVPTVPGTKSVDPDLPRQCPFPSVSLAHDVPCSTLGRTVNELEWALHNPLVWVIDSIVHSTKIGSLGCCAQDMIRGVFGMLSTRHEGNPSWTEGSRMLAMFDVPTVHKSLGGLERMERPQGHLKESWTSRPWEIAPNLNGPSGVFTYPRTKYLTWPFPSIVWLRSGTNMKVENLRSVPTWYKIRWPWSSTAVPFPIYVTCPWRSLFNSGPNSKWRKCPLLLVHGLPHAQHAVPKSSAPMLEESGETSSRHCRIEQKGLWFMRA